MNRIVRKLADEALELALSRVMKNLGSTHPGAHRGSPSRDNMTTSLRFLSHFVDTRRKTRRGAPQRKPRPMRKHGARKMTNKKR